MNLCASFSGLKLSFVLMMLLFYWTLSRRVILINFVFIQKDCITLSLHFSDQQLLELLKANAVWFFVSSVKEASICGFFKLFEPGRSCSQLVDQITGKTNEDQPCVNEFATFLSRQFWSSLIQSSVVLQITVQFVLDKLLQFSLKLQNELLLPAIKDEIKEEIQMEKSEEVSLH